MAYPPIILASRSPRRAALLEQIGVPFRLMPSDADESMPEGAPVVEAVERVARRKARGAARSLNADWGPYVAVLGADTVVCLGADLLGKPTDAEDAANMLQSLSGETHRVLTGVALALPDGGSESWVEETRVTFRDLTDDEIEAYVASGRPLDKAGAYGIQEDAAPFVARIEGCYFNVVGLPLARLTQRLSTLR